MPQTDTVLEQAPLSVDRRFYPDPPPGVDSGLDQLSPEGSFTDEIETGNLTLPQEHDDWAVSPEEGISPYGRWHKGTAHDIHTTADNSLVWEGETGRPIGIRDLPTGYHFAHDRGSELPTMHVLGSVSLTPSVDSVLVDDIEAVPVATPPIREGTKIMAARVNNDNRFTDDVLVVDHETGAQQLMVPTFELERVLNGRSGTETIDVEYWLVESDDANIPHATEPVTVSRDVLPRQMQEEIDEAWEDHMGEPLPDDPAERFSAQMEVLDGFEEVLEPIPEEATIEDPADLVVIILDQQATNNASTATVLAVSNPGYNVAQGYCNNVDQTSPQLSSYEQCVRPVDGDGRIPTAGHVYDEAPDVTGVYEAYAAQADGRDTEVRMVSGDEGSEGASAISIAGVGLLLAAGAAVVYKRFSGRKHIHSPADNIQPQDEVSLEVLLAEDGEDLSLEALNLALAALLNRLWGEGNQMPARNQDLSSTEIRQSVTLNVNGNEGNVLALLEGQSDFGTNTHLQLAHRLVGHVADLSLSE